jgi:hypothetical protein
LGLPLSRFEDGVQVVFEAAELAGGRLSDGADVAEFSDREDDLKVDL